MPPDYKTPGVYIEETPNFPPGINAVPTAVPAFIGYTMKAVDRNRADLTGIPTRINSLGEFETMFGVTAPETNLQLTVTTQPRQIIRGSGEVRVSFGGKPNNHLLYYALQLYFMNGGGACYVVSAGSFSTGNEPIELDNMLSALHALERVDAPTLVLFPEAQRMEEAAHYALIDQALALCARLRDRFCIVDLHETGEGTASNAVTIARNFREGIGSAALKFGAAYFPNLITSLQYVYDEKTVLVSISQKGKTLRQPVKVFQETDPVLYKKIKTALAQFPVVLPPSAALAGVYATTDAQRGVWKAPANVALQGVTGVTMQLTDGVRSLFNVDTDKGKSINCISAFTGKGILVWGARTLAGNDNEWRYVPVVRLFMMVEESCNKALQQFVFEPNDANTWVKVKGMIENFLTVLWRQGAMIGAKPEQAYFVQCGLHQTMTTQDILDGKMIVQIGMATVRPAEFIIFRITIQMQPS